MTKNLESAELNAGRIATEDGRFDHISIALHWLTVLLIAFQFTSIWVLETIGDKSPLGATLLSLHLTSGVLTWIVVVVRLAWRQYFAYLPPFSAGHTEISANNRKGQ